MFGQPVVHVPPDQLGPLTPVYVGWKCEACGFQGDLFCGPWRDLQSLSLRADMRFYEMFENECPRWVASAEAEKAETATRASCVTAIGA